MSTQFDWEGFRALAGRLESLLAGEATLAEDDTFIEACRRALAFLYVAGVSMPAAGDIFEDAGGDAFWERRLGADAAVADPLGAESEIDAISERLRVDLEVLQDDADDEDVADLVGAAARALWDTRESLSAGNEHYDARRLMEAEWEWSFGFDEWGAHAIAALAALHDLLWGAH